MANRSLTVLNPAGYQEILQAADKLIVPGEMQVNSQLTVGQPIINNGSGTSQLGDIQATTALFTGDITLDSNSIDSISIVLGTDGSVTLSGRLTSGSVDIGGSTVIDGILDEDNLASDSATKLATQQSIKAYVDTRTAEEKDFTIRGNTGADDTVSTGEILSIMGTAGEITTAITDNMVTIAFTQDVTVPRDLNITRNLQIAANGTLKFGTSTAVSSILDEDDFNSDSNTALATQQSIKAYVNNFPTATITDKGFLSASDKNKLDGVQTGATDDQTGAEIKALYELEANAYTDTKDTKLTGIETGAQVNVATNLGFTAGTSTLTSSTGTGVVIPAAVPTGNAGLLSGADAQKLNTLTSDLAGKADLVGGKLSTSQLPDLAITEFLGTVANESAMTALTGQKGDWAVRSDVGKVYVITGDDPTDNGDWTALAYPALPSDDILFAADSGATDSVVLGETVTMAGTTNQIVTTVTNNQVQYALTSNVEITGTLTADTVDADIDGGVYAS